MTISLCLSDEDTMLIKNMQSLTAFYVVAVLITATIFL